MAENWDMYGGDDTVFQYYYLFFIQVFMWLILYIFDNEISLVP